MSRLWSAAISEATRQLVAAGCVAADEEAQELAAAAHGEELILAAMVARRSTGEPLAWITGTVEFCGCLIAIQPQVFVPRWQSEPLAQRAAELLPGKGRAIDLGTGSGAIACALRARHPEAEIVGTEPDPVAAGCARQNGVTVVEGDLFQGIPNVWRSSVDVIVGVLPYVPTREIAFLPRDVQTFEPRAALDGGDEGLALVRRAVSESRHWLRRGGHLLLEIGGTQASLLLPHLESEGFSRVLVASDLDGDPRSIEAVAG